MLKKIQEWVTKAESEADPFNRYLSLFIAYNIFYNLYKKTQNSDADLFYGDSLRAIETQTLADSNFLIKTLEPELTEYINFIPVYREEFWESIPISRTLREVHDKENSSKTLDMLLRWLYKVRCNIIHGEKNYDDLQQKKLLGLSSILLEKVLAHLVDCYYKEYVEGSGKTQFT
jgi:hypothetical protein